MKLNGIVAWARALSQIIFFPISVFFSFYQKPTPWRDSFLLRSFRINETRFFSVFFFFHFYLKRRTKSQQNEASTQVFIIQHQYVFMLENNFTSPFRPPVDDVNATRQSTVRPEKNSIKTFLFFIVFENCALSTEKNFQIIFHRIYII